MNALLLRAAIAALSLVFYAILPPLPDGPPRTCVPGTLDGAAIISVNGVSILGWTEALGFFDAPAMDSETLESSLLAADPTVYKLTYSAEEGEIVVTINCAGYTSIETCADAFKAAVKASQKRFPIKPIPPIKALVVDK